MNEEGKKKVLEKFYDRLRRKTKEKKTLVNDSVIVTFLKSSKNTRYQLLKKSTRSERKIDGNLLHDLEGKGLVRETDDIGEYALTADGLWHIEKEKEKIDQDKILSFLDEEYFNPYKHSDKSLDFREKVVVFSMIAARSFSSDAKIDLSDDMVADHWEEVLTKSKEKLEELEMVSPGSKSLLSDDNSIHPVAALHRRMTKLPRRTKNIYHSTKQLSYYLDVADDGDISESDLRFLLEKVIGDSKLDYEQIQSIYDFLCDIAHQQNIYLFDSDHRFAKGSYDDELYDLLMDI